MKRVLLALSMAATLTAGGAAIAADIPGGPMPYYSSPGYSSPGMNHVFNWAGFYAGLNLGYEWGSVSNSGINPSGIAGGIQGGYNWQYNSFVYGGEADLNFSAAGDTFAPYKFSNPWFGTIRGRLGYAFSNVLDYGTGGFAFGDLTATSGAVDETKTLPGWTAGLGMEVGFTANWSARVEYLYLDLGDRAYTITGAQNGLQASVLRFGVNYHF
jgi:outer membrane immunogenic protein